MTSFAHIPRALTQELPFSLICAFEVPTTDDDPSIIPSVNVCVGNYSTQDDAEAVFPSLRHPALICVRIIQAFVFN